MELRPWSSRPHSQGAAAPLTPDPTYRRACALHTHPEARCAHTAQWVWTKPLETDICHGEGRACTKCLSDRSSLTVHVCLFGWLAGFFKGSSQTKGDAIEFWANGDHFERPRGCRCTWHLHSSLCQIPTSLCSSHIKARSPNPAPSGVPGTRQAM